MEIVSNIFPIGLATGARSWMHLMRTIPSVSVAEIRIPNGNSFVVKYSERRLKLINRHISRYD